MPPQVLQVNVNLPPNNRANNNGVFYRYAIMRNHMYQHALKRFSIAYATLFTPLHRKVIEYSLLIFALYVLVILSYIHATFVQSPPKCLDPYMGAFDGAGILRVEVLPNADIKNYSLVDSYWKEKVQRHREFDSEPYVLNGEDYLKFKVKQESIGVERMSQEGVYEKVEVSNVSLVEENIDLLLEKEALFRRMHVPEIMEFSTEYGYLKLRAAKRAELNVPVTFVILDADTETCFGNSFSRFLLKNLIAYDEVLLSSIKSFAESRDQKGFVRNVVMEADYIFVNIDPQDPLTAYFIAGFVMFVFTLSVRSILHHSHDQIFVVVAMFFGQPFAVRSPWAPILSIVLSLLGIEAVMSEFFPDRFTAINVVIIVWVADMYSNILIRTDAAHRHWPRFFYLYHFFFYAYCFRFSGVYWGLTLTASYAFTLHAMCYFYHHYELPFYLRWQSEQVVLDLQHNHPENPPPQENRQPENPDPPVNPEPPRNTDPSRNPQPSVNLRRPPANDASLLSSNQGEMAVNDIALAATSDSTSEISGDNLSPAAGNGPINKNNLPTGDSQVDRVGNVVNFQREHMHDSKSSKSMPHTECNEPNRQAESPHQELADNAEYKDDSKTINAVENAGTVHVLNIVFGEVAFIALFLCVRTLYKYLLSGAALRFDVLAYV